MTRWPFRLFAFAVLALAAHTAEAQTDADTQTCLGALFAHVASHGDDGATNNRAGVQLGILPSGSNNVRGRQMAVTSGSGRDIIHLFDGIQDMALIATYSIYPPAEATVLDAWAIDRRGQPLASLHVEQRQRVLQPVDDPGVRQRFRDLMGRLLAGARVSSICP